MSWQPTRNGQWCKFRPPAAEAAALVQRGAWMAPTTGHCVGIHYFQELLPNPAIIKNNVEVNQETAVRFPRRILVLDHAGDAITQENPPGSGQSTSIFYVLDAVTDLEPLVDPADLPPGRLPTTVLAALRP